jgi:hypothetical protein
MAGVAEEGTAAGHPDLHRDVAASPFGGDRLDGALPDEGLHVASHGRLEIVLTWPSAAPRRVIA